MKVAPTIGSSPLIRDMFGAGASDMQVVISETIGPIQAGVLPTALSIIGVKPFDIAHELSGRFDGAVSLLDPKAFAMRPVSLVLSVDGNRWPLLAREVLRSARVTVDGPAGVAEIPVAPLLDGAYDGRVATGSHRGAGSVPSPFASSLSYIGAITLAAASMPKRVTVIALTFRPDGSFDMSQNLFPIPGLGYDKLATSIPYARMVRDLQLGQSLYESGELIERAGSSELLTDLLSAKMTDPVLSCMAAFAWSDTGQSGHDLLAATARNLRRYFGDLADAQVIQGLAFPTEREQSLSDALDTNDLPVLARSAAELARYAHERRRHDRAVVALSRRVRPGQSWLMNWQAGDGRTSAQ